MLRILASCLLILIVIPPVWADGISVSQSIDASDIPYEGEAHFEVVITWNGPQSAYLFDQPLRPQFTRLKGQKFSSSIGSVGVGPEEVTTKRYSYTLKPVESGVGRIEPITIPYLAWPDSVPGQLITEAMTINIAAPVPVEESGGLGLAGIIIIIIIVAALGLGGWWFVRQRAKRRAKPVVKSPAEIFLERLEELKNDSAGDLKQFQTGLYRHLLDFLRERYGLRPEGESVKIVVEALNEVRIPDNQREKLAAWLERAEKEKFTPVTSAPGETLRLEAEIREFFENNML